MRLTPVRRSRRGAATAALLLAAGLGLAGCSSGSGSDAAGGAADTTEVAPQGAGLRDRADTAYDRALRSETAARADGPTTTSEVAAPAVVQTGSLTVESDDVARARFDLGKVVDDHGGTIADEKTTASSEGRVRLSRLVLRVPSAEFDEAMADLADLGKVTESTRKAEDVTGEVIDTRARVRAQEQSLARVEVLFARARTIRDVVAVEAQLSRRQADLDSLTGQLAYLEDQASFSTITVYLERTPEQPSVAGEDDTAFVAGLRNGWGALVALGTGLAALVGALLPFAVLALLLGVPVVVLVRRTLARWSARRPTAEA